MGGGAIGGDEAPVLAPFTLFEVDPGGVAVDERNLVCPAGRPSLVVPATLAYHAGAPLLVLDKSGGDGIKAEVLGAL